MATPKRTSRGRQKIALARITKEDARQVCFSKRRGGLFKKASELSVLCGSEVAIVAFSPAGRVFSFGHPSVDSVIDRFLTDDNGGSNRLSFVGGGGLHREYAELEAMTEAAMKQSDGLKEELRAKQMMLGADEDKMGLTELMEFERAVVDLRRSLAESSEQSMMMPMPSQCAMITASPPIALPFGVDADVGFGVKNEDEDVRLPPLPPTLDGFDYGHHHAFFGF